MKTPKSMGDSIPQHDYRPALQGALSWLGNRYLLAEPLNRRSDGSKLQASEPHRSQAGSPVLV